MGARNGRTKTAADRRQGWGDGGGNLVRAVAGGLPFGTPVLLTLEVWGIGSSATPPDMAVALLLTFVPGGQVERRRRRSSRSRTTSSGSVNR